MARTGPLLLAALCVCFSGQANGEYLGKFIGKLSELHHGVSGEVYAVDGRTLHIKDYTYDGQGPAAYFYASTSKTADSRGFRLRDENNNGDVIRRYRKEGVTLTLPEGKTLNNIKIFYVWCEEFDVNFGDVKIPRNFDFPRPQKIDALKGVHSISSDNIVVVDAQTLLIPNLHYDGEAPDAKFWVGRGSKPSPQGIRVPDENGKEVPLRRYDGKTVVLTLPGDLTVFDIGHFGIWCEQFTVDFGHIQIPQGLNIPPSLKMLGVSPQSKLNCEVLNNDLAFEVRWAVAGESIVLQLVGKLENREYMSFGLSGDDSKSVMIGGDVAVAWVDQDTLKGYAEDYYLGDKSQCSGPTGSCPDSRLLEGGNNIRLLNAAMVNGYSIVTYQRPLKASDQFDRPIYTNQSQAIIWAIGPLNQRDEVSFHTNHYLKSDSFIEFGRPAKWNCPLPEGETPDKQTKSPVQHRIKQEQLVEPEELPAPEVSEEPIEPSTTAAPRRDGGGQRRRGGTRISTRQPEIAEEGQASKRESTRTRGSNRPTQKETQSQTVPPPTPVKDRNAWYIPPIECYEPEDGVFYAQMGPTGGKRGYPAITGHVGWGISWYINGLLIPEINVVRGQTYNFITEGGEDPEISAKYHPFYITDDPIGGYAYKTSEEQKNITIFAGVRFDKNGEPHPTGTGRLCHWTHTGDKEADDFESFGAYQRTLQLKCDIGEPGVIQWTPDHNTPDTVYYQCFTHRYLGWKINVHDTCQQGAASELKLLVVEAPKDNQQDSLSDQSELEASPSIRQETMVMPNHILIEEIKADNRSHPTVSETLTTLPSPPPPPTTGQQKSDQIPNTSLLVFQSPPPPIVPSNKHHHFDLTDEDYSRKKVFISKRMTTTTVRPIMTDLRPNFRQYMINPLMAKNVPRVNQAVYLPVNAAYKKPYYLYGQTLLKTITHHTPAIYHIRPSEMPYKPVLKTPPQLFLNTLAIPIKTQLISTVKNVEVSPEQASTEREPDHIQTSTSSSPLLSIYPSSDEKTRNINGFRHESVVIERGFKPIIKFPEERLMEDMVPEIDDEGEIGIIHINGEKKFEILDNRSDDDYENLKLNKQKYKKVSDTPPLKKEAMKRSLIESDIEPEMAANERVESYYLPPPGQTGKPIIAKAKLPSEIDFEAPPLPTNDKIHEGQEPSSSQIGGASPPDTVVTFDGKRVSGASLTAKPFEKSVVLERGSKATEFLKAHPQSVPFHGDLPPLTANVLFNVKVPHQGVLNRDLDTPLPPATGSTKLRRVRRAAHHTPEHTAQQMQELALHNNNNSTSSGAGGLKEFRFGSLLVVTGTLLLYLMSRG